MISQESEYVAKKFAVSWGRENTHTTLSQLSTLYASKCTIVSVVWQIFVSVLLASMIPTLYAHASGRQEHCGKETVRAI